MTSWLSCCHIFLGCRFCFHHLCQKENARFLIFNCRLWRLVWSDGLRRLGHGPYFWVSKIIGISTKGTTGSTEKVTSVLNLISSAKNVVRTSCVSFTAMKGLLGFIKQEVSVDSTTSRWTALILKQVNSTVHSCCSRNHLLSNGLQQSKAWIHQSLHKWRGVHRLFGLRADQPSSEPHLFHVAFCKLRT